MKTVVTDLCLLNVNLFYSKCGKKIFVESNPTMGLKPSTVDYNLHKKGEEGI